MAHSYKLFITSLTIVLFSSLLNAQRYEMKKQITPKNSAPLLKIADDLFTFSGNLNFNISTNDAFVNLNDIADATAYDIRFLNAYRDSVRKDSLNPIYFYQLGQYYANNYRQDIAGNYYNRAISKMHIKYFKNDSAVFYQSLGFINLALGLETGIHDLANAIRLNPRDSISFLFMAFSIFQKHDFDKLHNLCLENLDKNNSFHSFSFLMLLYGDILGSAMKLAEKSENDKAFRAECRKKDYNQLLDFTNIDKYYQKYKHQPFYQTIRNYADILGLMCKLIVFEIPKNQWEIKIQYTKNDIKRLKELELWLLAHKSNKTINEYSLHKCLGMVYIMQNKKPEAYSAFKTAIRAFPPAKKSVNFNPSECYDALIYLSKVMKTDENEFLDNIEMKIAQDDSVNRSNDCMFLALYYFDKKDYDKAWSWCTQAGMYNKYNFEALVFYAHLCYRKSDMKCTEYHVGEAMKYVSSYDQQKKVSLQAAVYLLINNDATNAYNYINLAIQAMQGGICEECEKLIKDYIKIIPN